MSIQKESTDNLTKRLSLIIICMGLSLKAHALFMVEPHYENISGKFSVVAGQDGTLRGHSFGLRLGYLGQYFMAGMNVEKGSYTYDSQITSYGNQYFSGGGIGTFLGFHFIDRWRIWTGYLNSALEPVNDESIRYFGQQVSLGIGYRVFGGWMINYTYFNNYFTQYEDDVTGRTGSLSSDIRVTGNAFSLSFIQVY